MRPSLAALATFTIARRASIVGPAAAKTSSQRSTSSNVLGVSIGAAAGSNCCSGVSEGVRGGPKTRSVTAYGSKGSIPAPRHAPAILLAVYASWRATANIFRKSGLAIVSKRAALLLVTCSLYA